MVILARESRGLTQRELGERLGLHQGRISRIEGGLKELPPLLLSELSRALDYPEAFFYQTNAKPENYFWEAYSMLPTAADPQDAFIRLVSGRLGV